jgi:hypothetical protein
LEVGFVIAVLVLDEILVLTQVHIIVTAVDLVVVVGVAPESVHVLLPSDVESLLSSMTGIRDPGVVAVFQLSEL